MLGVEVFVDVLVELLVGTRGLCGVEITAACDVTVGRVEVEGACDGFEIEDW